MRGVTCSPTPLARNSPESRPESLTDFRATNWRHAGAETKRLQMRAICRVNERAREDSNL
jgi:hypothetical protein